MKQTHHLFLAIAMLFLFACQDNSKNETSTSATISTVDTLQAELLYEIKADLGEGALWNVEDQQFYWVDIEKMELHIYNPSTQKDTSFSMPSRPGTVVNYKEDEVVLALQDGAYIFNTATGELQPFALIQEVGTRFNDGKCDPSGRFWVGTMEWNGASPIGNLYMINEDGTYEIAVDSITISNGIVWNKAKNKMYYIDTPTQEIASFDYDNETGRVSNRKAIVQIDQSMGSPDGMAIDENDNLWVGLWNGDAVVCYDPETGELIKRVEVPAHNVTACAFGGPNLDILYITTSSLDMTKEEKEAYPLAGSLFTVDPGVKGTVSPHFGGKND